MAGGHRDAGEAADPDDRSPVRAVVPAGGPHSGEHPVGREWQRSSGPGRCARGPVRRTPGAAGPPPPRGSGSGGRSRWHGCACGRARWPRRRRRPGRRGAGPVGGPVGDRLDGPDEDRRLARRRGGDHLDDLVLPAGCQTGRLARTARREEAVDPTVEEARSEIAFRFLPHGFEAFGSRVSRELYGRPDAPTRSPSMTKSRSRPALGSQSSCGSICQRPAMARKKSSGVTPGRMAPASSQA